MSFDHDEHEKYLFGSTIFPPLTVSDPLMIKSPLF